MELFRKNKERVKTAIAIINITKLVPVRLLIIFWTKLSLTVRPSGFTGKNNPPRNIELKKETTPKINITKPIFLIRLL